MRRGQSDFEGLGARIVTISFGPAPKAPVWLDCADGQSVFKELPAEAGYALFDLTGSS